MKHYSKAQLHAISRSYTERAQKKAVAELKAAGVDYTAFCKMFNYHGSPVLLLTQIQQRKAATLEKISSFKAL